MRFVIIPAMSLSVKRYRAIVRQQQHNSSRYGVFGIIVRAIREHKPVFFFLLNNSFGGTPNADRNVP